MLGDADIHIVERLMKNKKSWESLYCYLDVKDTYI